MFKQSARDYNNALIINQKLESTLPNEEILSLYLLMVLTENILFNISCSAKTK